MRLAEEMLLNAKMYGLVPYNRRDENNNRCALGLLDDYGARDTATIKFALPDKWAAEKYPWIMQSVHMPCDCRHDWIISLRCGGHRNAESAIAHLFNEHVMQGKQQERNAEPWTLEQLADWIDSVDPTPRDSAEPKPQFVHDEFLVSH